ncbi:AAA family ATPase [Candidatus Saganbacteria bacterium]|nr:AAA family ATPase [Candidatus Saganbacteria bacterium]
MSIELNDLFKRALELLENSGKSVFITGKAGTGKSTLLQYFREHTKKKIVVLAPTGVAAINVQGETIHSFFGFKPDITLEKVKKIKFKPGRKNIYKEIDAIVIDEISMVRADLLDCVDKFLRLNGKNRLLPFGGLQMIFIGDLYQLPPVVTGEEKHIFKGHYQSEYFFDARVFGGMKIEYIELEKVYRQKDEAFIGLLNAVRNNTAGEKELAELNARLIPDHRPAGDYSICLTTTNKMAGEINEAHLARLPGKTWESVGKISGEFKARQLPTEIELKLKNGAQIMLLNNDQMRRWVNGTLGKIKKIKESEIEVELRDGRVETVRSFEWQMFHFQLDGKTGRLETETVGSFIQFPIKLAWAITIHKSQGKTFDKVIIDLGRGTFAHGQLYVALSRCTSLKGIVLKRPVKKQHIIMDYRVVKFITSFQYRLSEENMPLDQKIQIIEEAIRGGGKLTITYLKAQDEKSRREIAPFEIGEMEYNGKMFLGVKAYCRKRGEERVFRVDRILEMEKA